MFSEPVLVSPLLGLIPSGIGYPTKNAISSSVEQGWGCCNVKRTWVVVYLQCGEYYTDPWHFKGSEVFESVP